MSMTSRSRQHTGREGSTNLAGAKTFSKTQFQQSQYSLPTRSMDAPLRSVLLDPKVNNIPPSKTLSDLKAKIKKLGYPHNSYDMDGDGEVSQDDYKLAKQFDTGGKGYLSDEEFHFAKSHVVNGFVSEHQGEMNALFGTSMLPETTSGRSKNFGDSRRSSSGNFGNSMSFMDSTASFDTIDEAYNKMQTVKKTLKVSGSWPIKQALTLKDDTLIKHNFYTNKFDQTAWNDFDAVPRSSSIYGLSDHGGSLKRLMFARRQSDREHADALMEQARAKLPVVDTRRLKLISDMSVENS